MPRKIIQIAAVPDLDIIALCNDGSLWITHTNGLTTDEWDRLPDIPQHNRKAETSDDFRRRVNANLARAGVKEGHTS